MVGKMRIIRWPSWPYLSAAKFEVIFVVHRMEGLDSVRFDGDDEASGGDRSRRSPRRRPVVEIKWKGPKTVALKRSVTRNLTEEGGCRGDGVVEWNEEFKRHCEFSVYKDDVFLPWEVALTVFSGMNQREKKNSVIGKASLNISDLYSPIQEDDVHVKLPLKLSSSSSSSTPSLHISIRFVAIQSSPDRQRSILPILWSPPNEKSEFSVKSSLRKIKTFNQCISMDQTDEIERKSPDRNRESESSSPFDSDSREDDDNDDDNDAEGDNDRDDDLSDPINYKTLTHANWARRSYHEKMNPEDEDLIYYSNGRADMEDCGDKNSKESIGSMMRMLSWKKRKLSFISAKKNKGEPLLNKDYCEEGGDDIDFDRRQLSSSESISEFYKSDDSNRKSGCDFGDDDGFVVGCWETKEIVSRDGMMKLAAQVFFASIDQRSESAAGESACTALVAVIAHWLQSNKDVMPTRSEFDSLIREGSTEWRNLCVVDEYRERFPDKHFDLESLLQAKIRPICVIPEKSFVGFFHPEKSEEEDEEKDEICLDFLNGVMSFESIWEEIMKEEEMKKEQRVYVVSWNDHFFILMIDHDAYYIIDTLGERLYEGCSQAYVLKFDKDTEIYRLPAINTDLDVSSGGGGGGGSPADQKPSGKNKDKKNKKKKTKNKKNMSEKQAPAMEDNGKVSEEPEASTESSSEEIERGELICRGKESCREYIRSFLAAIPIRQLKSDMKKGHVSSFHHRLQIELHCTGRFDQSVLEFSEIEAAGKITDTLSDAASVPVVVA